MPLHPFQQIKDNMDPERLARLNAEVAEDIKDFLIYQGAADQFLLSMKNTVLSFIIENKNFSTVQKLNLINHFATPTGNMLLVNLITISLADEYNNDPRAKKLITLMLERSHIR